MYVWRECLHRMRYMNYKPGLLMQHLVIHCSICSTFSLVMKTPSLYAHRICYMYGNAKNIFSARTRRQLKYRYSKMVNTGKNCLSYGHKCRAVTRCVAMKGNKFLGRISVSLSVPLQCLGENTCASR